MNPSRAISQFKTTHRHLNICSSFTEIGRKMFASMAKALLLVGSALAMLIASALASPVPGWLCPDNTPAAYDRFCNTGRSLTEVELGVINRVFNTDKRVVGSTIKRFD